MSTLSSSQSWEVAPGKRMVPMIIEKTKKAIEDKIGGFAFACENVPKTFLNTNGSKNDRLF